MEADGLLLSAQEREAVRRGRALALSEIAPHAAAWEHAGSALPRPVFRAYAEAGLIGLEVSRQRGGSGLGYLCKIGLAEAMARTCLPSTFALNLAQGMATRIEREGSESQVRRHLPSLICGERIAAVSLSEPGAGSDFSAIATRAERAAGGWRLHGTKAWVTNGAHADLALVYAQTEPGSGAAGIASFLVELHADGVSRVADVPLIGGHAIGAATIVLDGVFVADDDLFAPPGQAFKRALTGITGARIHVSAMACGIVTDSLARAVDHGRVRHSFGRPLIEHQGLRWSLADVATGLEAARALTYSAAQRIAAGADATLAAAHAKRFSADMALSGVAACMQAMGGVGLRADLPFGRHLAAARIVAYVDGTTEMMRDRIGADLARRRGGRLNPEAPR
ncbi:acyl-CoA dehydrogenase family protein [Methylobacterium sp. J-026]|uniref:acyl-CoA dehydrogenase family protein n=1 Tax=Methylobacterium sp. J-026 TaxID=2836624 RepID=UPI001FBACACE|nr:acyl-CoA dehydrogenase family protein [Methylobacterium sp. J-026]MCJ2135798.1 acyl-CoA dehydrogenase family protein [Methylobacterium sp. J-026]